MRTRSNLALAAVLLGVTALAPHLASAQGGSSAAANVPPLAPSAAPVVPAVPGAPTAIAVPTPAPVTSSVVPPTSGSRLPPGTAPAPLAPPAMLGLVGPLELPPLPADGTPLRLTDVLTSTRQSYPLLRAAQLDITRAQGALLEAAGGFDFSWKTRASVMPLGYYQHRQVDTQVDLPTQFWGLRAWAGYRIGDGHYPPYYGYKQTLSRGEARAGLFLPVLRGGPIDSRRAAIRIGDLAVDVAEVGVAEKQLDYARTASQRYWAWVSAGQKVRVARSLLARAVERDAAMATRVDRGDLASVERLDNARAILQRQAQVVSAERGLTQAALALSLYFRSSEGQPVAPPVDRLPPSFPEPVRLSSSPDERAAQALERRPELRRYDLQRRQYEVERSLHSNARLPAIDLQGVVARDFGVGGPDNYAREPTEVEVSVLIDIPLQNRVASGKLAQAEAKLAKNDAEARLARDRVVMEVRDAMNAVDTAYLRVEVARRELDVARRLEQAERQRFDLGDTTLLVVNLREQAAFEAAQREVDALADYHTAYATYRAASADFLIASFAPFCSAFLLPRAWLARRARPLDRGALV